MKMLLKNSFLAVILVGMVTLGTSLASHNHEEDCWPWEDWGPHYDSWDHAYHDTYEEWEEYRDGYGYYKKAVSKASKMRKSWKQKFRKAKTPSLKKKSKREFGKWNRRHKSWGKKKNHYYDGWMYHDCQLGYIDDHM